MSFLEPDDYLIIMDMNVDHYIPGTELTLDEVKMMRDSGVKTMYYQAAVRWDEMQPAPGSPINWSNVDTWVERQRKAGMKMLIPFVFSYPKWLDKEFFLSHEYDAESRAYGVPNYTSKYAFDMSVDWMSKVIDRYEADDVQIIYSGPINGEFANELFPRTPHLQFDTRYYINWVNQHNRMLAAYHGEIWTTLNAFINPTYWYEFFNALRQEFPVGEFDHYGIVFTFVQHINLPHVKQKLLFNQEAGMVYYGGTEYVQGMKENAPILKGNGARMMTAPKHPYQNYKAIEPWMLDEIKRAIDYYGR